MCKMPINSSLRLSLTPILKTRCLDQKTVGRSKKPIFRKHHSQGLLLSPLVFSTLVHSKRFGLPDTAIAFDYKKFGFGIWGQGAPASLGTWLYTWTEGRLSGTHVSSYPEGTH